MGLYLDNIFLHMYPKLIQIFIRIRQCHDTKLYCRYYEENTSQIIWSLTVCFLNN